MPRFLTYKRANSTLPYFPSKKKPRDKVIWRPMWAPNTISLLKWYRDHVKVRIYIAIPRLTSGLWVLLGLKRCSVVLYVHKKVSFLREQYLLYNWSDQTKRSGLLRHQWSSAGVSIKKDISKISRSESRYLRHKEALIFWIVRLCKNILILVSYH